MTDETNGYYEGMDPGLDREKQLLGALLMSPEIVWDVMPLLEPEDFADGRNETVYRAVLRVAERTGTTDPITVADELRSSGQLIRVGGEASIHQLTMATFSYANAPFWADGVHEAAIRRRLTAAGRHVAHLAAEAGNVHELAEQARSAVDAAVGAEHQRVTPVGDRVNDVLASLSEAPRFIPSPWGGLNYLVGGFRPSALYVIGARPGSGKTIMGLQAAAKLAQRGPVAFASLEMSEADLTKRLLAQTALVHMTSLTNNHLNPLEWERLGKAKPYVQELPLFINDRPGQTVQQVRAFARTVSRKGPLAAVVVDYLQLMRPSDSKKPRWEAVGEMSGALKNLSRELDAPVIALCQLNRGTEGALQRPPTLGDLRESGSIEQDADVVLLLQREFDPVQEEYTNRLNVTVAKNRHGATGGDTLMWEGHHARVIDSGW